MLPIDPGDGPGRCLPGGQTPAPPEGVPDDADRHPNEHAGTGTQPLTDIVPLQAMPHGGTIIRPGAVAWGGTREAHRHTPCEAIERALAAAAADPAGLPALLTALATARLWVPLPAVQRPFTDGTAVRLPLVTRKGADFVPCFTSVLRLTAWADQADVPAQRAGDPRVAPSTVAPHIVVPAAGLAGRLPAGLGLALNPGSTPGLPLYPECLPLLAELAANGRAAPRVVEAWTACNTERLYVHT